MVGTCSHSCFSAGTLNVLHVRAVLKSTPRPLSCGLRLEKYQSEGEGGGVRW